MSGANADDEIPYPSAPYPYTHPDHIAAIATLMGLHPQPADRARVLEVGCADGANLIPMALTLPGSRFVGIDLSKRAIAAGQEVVAQLALKNIELRHTDLMEFEAPAGSFDYIIAHGLLSWTPHSVQERLFELCRRCLAPQGIAFVSYNVYPGWQRRIILREWLQSAIASEPGSQRCADTARRRMRCLHDVLKGSDDDEAQRLVRELQTLVEWNDGYLLHDLLESHNQPFTFGEFLKRLEPHQLRFLAEADFGTMAGADLPTELSKGIQRAALSATGLEQLSDVLSGRAFRQSLLCRADQQPADRIAPEAIHSMYIVSTLRRATSGGSSSVRFASRQRFIIDVDRPEIIAALDRLAESWPQGAFFCEVAEASVRTQESPRRRKPDGAAWQNELATILLAGFVERAVELHTLPPAYSLLRDDFPQASPLARLQAARGSLVTNLRHDLTRLSSTEAKLLVLLDGTRHSISLAAEMSARVQPSSDDSSGITTADVNQILDRFARHALLVR